MNNTVRFESKKDGWIVTILWVNNLLCLGTIFLIIFQGQNAVVDTIVSLILVATIILIHSILVNTYYLVDDEELVIIMGFFTKRIPLKNITEMKMKVDILSSAALSIQRVQIKHKKNRTGIQISPVDRKKFIFLVHQRRDSLSNYA